VRNGRVGDRQELVLGIRFLVEDVLGDVYDLDHQLFLGVEFVLLELQLDILR